LLDDNPYLEFFADGGYIVETMAKLLYPDGRKIGGWDKPAEASAQTQQAIADGNCTLFEATIIHGRMLARLDILPRFGKVLRLIEVKSASVDTASEQENPLRGKRGGIDSKWRPYLEDVTFQTVVLRRVFPDFEIKPYLCVVDKARTATDNSVFDKFRLERDAGALGRFRPRVEYGGDASKLPEEHVLSILNVSDEVAELESEVAVAADALAVTVHDNSVDRIPPVIGQKCKMNIACHCPKLGQMDSVNAGANSPCLTCMF
jgi:hypothetical protein